ncbi:hypothetical protein [Zobellia nedashkovskayae]|uniref:hypothetical protein n=1 Tax=Zobellia nedashkovskayae TaxID=2779510 RepID=UPI00188CFF0F|nr:hypothetical protein [Zobellia nedashkovskayae]
MEVPVDNLPITLYTAWLDFKGIITKKRVLKTMSKSKKFNSALLINLRATEIDGNNNIIERNLINIIIKIN